ncbi:hypothetical protein SAMN02745206_00217 [Desulfacinum infernum DSM 9756]|uniref:Uncharacterized protein n=1 Tax=Desulfacinum infernum DSM 9756 TaxID=1121391 RepID=A0A1M4T7S1_9BACT|nr:hypothetical protein [Desulfacinum infernum]MBC7360527.1 hypothetical protein [Desulfacinum sp.]SHE40378.1 hypothetical protein SAMN02745206_00217 [Desulfacinum infernum DSM 9756]
MAVSHQTDDAGLEQKIAVLVQQILRREADELFAEKIAAFIQENERRSRELSLMDLREIEVARFEAAERRFEVIDKRFEALQRQMNARFEAVDQWFQAMDKHFLTVQ